MTAVSEDFARLLGYAPDELISQSLLSVVGRYDIDEVREILGRRDHDEVAFLCTILTRDGDCLMTENLGVWENAHDGRRLRGTTRVCDRALKRLRESERRFRDFAESAADWLWEMDANLRFTYFSPSFARTLGREASHILGKTRWKVAAADPKVPPWPQHIETLTNRKPFHDFRYWHHGNPRQPRYVSISGKPVFDQAGQFIGYRGVGQDLTELYRAEKSLNAREGEIREVRSRMRSVLDTLPANVAVLDRTGCIIDVNQSWRRYGEKYGLQLPNGGIGANYLDICFTAAGEGDRYGGEARSAIESVLFGRQEVAALEYPCDTPTQAFWYRLIAAPITLPDGPGAVVMHVDITDRKRAEARLRRSEEQFREISHAIPVPFVLFRYQDGGIVFANSRFNALYGRDPAAGEDDSPLPGYTGPIDRDALLRHLEASGGRVENMQFEGRSKHGERQHLSVTASMLEFRRETMVVAVFTDVTEQKRMEAALKEQEQQLRQRHKVEALGTLAGGIAHDFNNLLQPITMLTESVLGELPEDSALHEDLHDVVRASQRATELVAQILSFARAEEVSRTPHDLAKEVRESLQIARQVLPTTIQVTMDIADVGCVSCTSSDIQQILLNLATNARDAMDGKGHFIVTLTRANIDQFVGERGERLPPGAYAHLSVSDTGSGMTSETMERIFDPFFTTKEVGAGTGMGLSAVQGIVEACGGDILVESRPGEGTTFDILLPLCQGER